MSRTCSEVSCEFKGRQTDSATCPTCGHETGQFDPWRDALVLNGTIENVPLTALPDPPRIIYESELADGVDRSDKRATRMRITLTIYFTQLVMCIIFAVDDRFRVLFILGAILAIQGGILNFRMLRMDGPVRSDHDAQSRVTAPLMELCVGARCEFPRVSIKRYWVAVGVLRQDGRSTLIITPDVLALTDDAALRAIISHEVVHIRSGDIAAARLMSRLLFLIPGLVMLAGVIEHGGWLPFAFYFAFLFPAVRILAVPVGFLYRKQETRADLEGANAIGDPEALIRGLQVVSGIAQKIRDQIYGRSILKWAYFPYSIPPTTHPPMIDRIDRLRNIGPFTN